jgi:hypothetical protein
LPPIDATPGHGTAGQRSHHAATGLTRLAERLPLRILIGLAALTALAACTGDTDTRPSPTAVVATPTPTSVPETQTPVPQATRLTIERAATFYGRDEGDTASGMVAGDFNGDGAMDVLLAASQADGPANGRTDAGEVYLFLGPFQAGDERDAGQGQEALTVYGADPGDQLGRAMAAGDVNGDGFDDLVLSAPFADGLDEKRPDSGQVHILFGSLEMGQEAREIDLAATSSDVTIYGADAGDLAGFAIATADVHGDGIADLILGALWADGPDNARSRAGDIYVISGAPAPPPQLDLAAEDGTAVIFGAQPDDRLGETVATGDVNGDGVDDLILPAPFASGPQNAREAAGETYVIFGPPPTEVDIARGQQDITIVGVDAGDQLGHSLGSADFDGDGMADILLAAVSADGLDNLARLAGEAAVVFGTDQAGLQVDVAAGDAASLIYAANAGDRLGRSAAVGHINDDRLADLLIAAPGDDGFEQGRINVGAIYIIFGSSSLPAAIFLADGAGDLIIEGLDEGDILGTEVFATPALLAQDMDGDGRDEVLVSAPRGDGPDDGRQDAGEGYIVFLETALDD